MAVLYIRESMWSPVSNYNIERPQRRNNSTSLTTIEVMCLSAGCAILPPVVAYFTVGQSLHVIMFSEVVSKDTYKQHIHEYIKLYNKVSPFLKQQLALTNNSNANRPSFSCKSSRSSPTSSTFNYG